MVFSLFLCVLRARTEPPAGRPDETHHMVSVSASIGHAAPWSKHHVRVLADRWLPLAHDLSSRGALLVIGTVLGILAERRMEGFQEGTSQTH